MPHLIENNDSTFVHNTLAPLMEDLSGRVMDYSEWVFEYDEGKIYFGQKGRFGKKYRLVYVAKSLEEAVGYVKGLTDAYSSGAVIYEDALRKWEICRGDRPADKD